MPIILIFYIPMGFLMKLWLPAYSDSILFLGIMLPMCIFDGKMSLLGNTYYKLFRLEKKLLLINVITLTVNVVLTIIGAVVLKNLTLVTVINYNIVA